MAARTHLLAVSSFAIGKRRIPLRQRDGTNYVEVDGVVGNLPRVWTVDVSTARRVAAEPSARVRVAVTVGPFGPSRELVTLTGDCFVYWNAKVKGYWRLSLSSVGPFRLPSGRAVRMWA